MRIYEYAVSLVHRPKIKLPEFASFEDALIQTTCGILQIDSIEIHQRNRKEKVKRARWIIWEIMMATQGYTLQQAGEMFGDPYDHTTVINGLDGLVRDLDSCEYLKLIYDHIIRTLGVAEEKIIEFRAQRAFRAKDRKIRNPKLHIS